MSSGRDRRWPALAVTVVGWLTLCLTGLPAAAAEDTEADGLDVTIEALSPARLSSDATVTMSGRVENTSDEEWTNVQAYLVMARSPFTTAEQVETAMTSDSTYTGDRITTIGLFDEVGDLPAGESARYELEVPLEEIGLTGAQGVYPVGVQILATDADGNRPMNSVARATTFLPWLDDPRDPVATGLVWSFVLDPRQDDEAADARRLIDAVGDGGRLRGQLDLARATPTESRTIVVDPAVLDACRQLAEGRAPYDTAEEEERQAAQAFHDDLVDLARASAVWNVDYDRPDRVSLADRPDLEERLLPRIEEATRATLDEHGINGRSAQWSMETGITRSTVEKLRADGDDPVLVRSSALPGWAQRDGTLVTRATGSGPAIIAVNDTATQPSEAETTVMLRQRLLTQATLAALSRAADPESRADAVTFVDPAWTPEPDTRPRVLGDALGNGDLTAPTTLDRLVTDGLDDHGGELPQTPVVEPLAPQVLTAADDLADAGDLIAAVSGRQDASDTDRDLASALSVRWRGAPERAVRSVEQRADELRASLQGIEVIGPGNVTLSGSQGSFPITVNNPTRVPITVKIELDPSNPALSSTRLDEIEVAPGERRTVNAEIDLGRQSLTSVTAQAIADDRPIGSPAYLNVRSSQVGTIVWVAMGVAVAGFVVAVGRRFTRRGFRRRAEPGGGADG